MSGAATAPGVIQGILIAFAIVVVLMPSFIQIGRAHV